MKALKAVYLANAREFLRNRSSLLFVLLLPVAFAAFFGLLFGGGSGPFALQAAVGEQVAGAVAPSHPLRAVDFYMPHLLGMALLWLGLFGTAAPLVEQREAQVLRRLSVTPLSSNRLLAAQVLWRLTVGLLQTGLFLIVGYLGFGVGVAGNPLLFAAGVSLGALVFIGMGYLLAGLASSSEGVNALGQMVNFPMMFLSGTFFPVEMMPESFRPAASLLPATYLNDALRQVMVAAPAAHPLTLDFAILSGWLVAMLALAARFWRWE